jgi:hypothetical protein
MAAAVAVDHLQTGGKLAAVSSLVAAVAAAA